MSVKTRQQERLEIVSVFLRELANMDGELYWHTLEFIVSIGILFLIFDAQLRGWVGVPVVGFIMSVDVVRAFEAWKEAKIQMQREDSRQ